MRVILLLVSLVIILLVAYQELELGSGTPAGHVTGTAATGPQGLPRVPTNPQDLQNFNKQINTYVQHAATHEAKEIQQQTK